MALCPWGPLMGADSLSHLSLKNKQAGYLKEKPDSGLYHQSLELLGRQKRQSAWFTFDSLPPQSKQLMLLQAKLHICKSQKQENAS